MILVLPLEEIIQSRDYALQLCQDLGIVVNLKKSESHLSMDGDQVPNSEGCPNSGEDQESFESAGRVCVLPEAVNDYLERSVRSSFISVSACSGGCLKISSVVSQRSLGLLRRVKFLSSRLIAVQRVFVSGWMSPVSVKGCFWRWFQQTSLVWVVGTVSGKERVIYQSSGAKSHQGGFSAFQQCFGGVLCDVVLQQHHCSGLSKEVMWGGGHSLETS